MEQGLKEYTTSQTRADFERIGSGKIEIRSEGQGTKSRSLQELNQDWITSTKSFVTISNHEKINFSF